MALFTGTRIGADGRRYPADAEDIPDNADEERPKLVPVFGVPADGEVPVWNDTRNRLEFTAAGGGGGGETPELTALEERVTDLEASAILSASGVTHIEQVTQAEYDALTPDANTVYVIVPT
jgi:hypothetical protein